MCIHTYIYIYRERERCRCNICIYIERDVDVIISMASSWRSCVWIGIKLHHASCFIHGHRARWTMHNTWRMTFDAQEKCFVLCESSIKHGQFFWQNVSEELVDLESQIGRAKQQIQPTPPKCKQLYRCNAVAVLEILDSRYKWGHITNGNLGL